MFSAPKASGEDEIGLVTEALQEDTDHPGHRVSRDLKENPHLPPSPTEPGSRMIMKYYYETFLYGYIIYYGIFCSYIQRFYGRLMPDLSYSICNLFPILDLSSFSKF